MPIVAHTPLPTYDRLRAEGHVVLTPERAREQDIRGLHIGLLNMMPDAALHATERQFFRLVGSSNPISQFYIHLFTLPEIPRGQGAKAHIAEHYEDLQSVQNGGLDALIISGANVTEPDLAREVFWEPLIQVMNWADEHVPSTLCSCLTSHAVMQFRYDQRRRGLPLKRWGVFDHMVVDRSHPFVHDVNTRMDVPHSRFNDVSREQFDAAGLHVLIEGEEAGVQLAVSADGFRTVFFQGHPEYDQISLMKEYKREVGLFINGFSQTYPPFPAHYFNNRSQALLNEYEQRVRSNLEKDKAPPTFPEKELLPGLHNTWHDSGESVVGNWIGCVYQATNSDRTQLFMDGIDPDNPLNWEKLNGGTPS